MQDYLGMRSFARSLVNGILHRRFGGIEPDDKRIIVQLGIRESLFVRARLEIAHNNHNHRNQQVNCNFSFQQIIARTDSSQSQRLYSTRMPAQTLVGIHTYLPDILTSDLNTRFVADIRNTHSFH